MRKAKDFSLANYMHENNGYDELFNICFIKLH